MQTYRLSIRPMSVFGTPLRGDTLFGQLCWAVAEHWGASRLTELLEGYTAGRPFCVLSDALPAAHVPRPALPTGYDGKRLADPTQRKAEKKKAWLPVDSLRQPSSAWSRLAVSLEWRHATAQMHNSIDRRSGTTGEDGFGPYEVAQTEYRGLLDVYVVIDEARWTAAEARAALCAIGAFGYGRDATTGSGRFEVVTLDPLVWPRAERPNAFLTLGPCAPQGVEWDASRSWYAPLVRFGRHGGRAAVSERPWKSPVLLADVGAVLTPATWAPAMFVGQGLGGDGCLSRAMAETVHQGYAPCVPVRLAAEAA